MDALTTHSAGTVAAPFFDHALCLEARLVMDGCLVHALPSRIMGYEALFQLAAHNGWTADRVALVETVSREMRQMIYETRRLKLLAQMRSCGYDC